MVRRSIAGLLPLLVLVGCTDQNVVSPESQPALSGMATCTVTNVNNSGAGSLRDRIADPACNTIDFAYTSGTITVLTPLVITRSVTIMGSPGAAIAVSGGGSTRVFDIVGNVDVSVYDLTVKEGFVNNGTPPVGAGDIFVFRGAGIRIRDGANVSLEGMILSENHADEGGALHLDGAATVVELKNSTVAGNTETGIYVRGGDLTILATTISGNFDPGLSGSGNGGAISHAGKSLTIKGSTIFGNEARDYGGAIFAFGTTLIENSTISGNESTSAPVLVGSGATMTMRHVTVTANESTEAGPFGSDGRNAAIEVNGTLFLQNSVVSGNTAVGDYPDSDIAVSSMGVLESTNSIIGSTNNSGWGHGIVDGANGNKVGLAPAERAGLFYPLGQNGGPTATHGLRPGSLALDHVSAAACTLSTDQRGAARPGPGSTACDAGAVEGLGEAPPVEEAPPVVTISPDQQTTLNEGGALPVHATFTDPNAALVFTATVRCYAISGFGTLDVGGTATVTHAGPPVQGTVSGSCNFGDTSRSGTFQVTVTVKDADGLEGSASFQVKVNNVNPTVLIDKSGATTINGVPTIITKINGSNAFGAQITDPGSDDLSLSWSWGHGSNSTATYLVNGPALDPFPSPSMNARNVNNAQSKAWPNACFYQVALTATDDDSGVGSDAVKVIVAGASGRARGAGYWYNTYLAKRAKDFSPATLTCYLSIARHMSAVFDEVVDGTSAAAKAVAVLKVSNTSDPLRLLDYQLLAAWLNFANGSFGWSDLVDTDADGIVDTPFSTAVQAAEAVRLDPNAGAPALLIQKNILESINLMHGG